MRAPVPLPMAAIVLIAAVALPHVQAAEKVWSGLVMAENVEKPKPVPDALQGIQKTLVSLFGYNQFEVIGESEKSLNTGQEDWLASSKYFSLNVDATGASENGYELNLKLYQEKQLLLETSTKLSKQSPLVIKGPQIGSGQLLLVLIVDGEGAKKESTHSRHHTRREQGGFSGAWQHLKRIVRRGLP